MFTNDKTGFAGRTITMFIVYVGVALSFLGICVLLAIAVRIGSWIIGV